MAMLRMTVLPYVFAVRVLSVAGIEGTCFNVYAICECIDFCLVFDVRLLIQLFLWSDTNHCMCVPCDTL